MTTNHIDQLTEWWSEAEHAPFREGDVLIARFDDRPMPFEVYPAGCDSDAPAETVRVLSRAPKPKPAWHDAIAVTATATDDLGDEITAVWVREGDELWRSDEGGMVLRDDLRDVTPLIEAKVTDEMRDRVRDYYRTEHQVELPRDDVWLNELLTAALGLEAA